MLVKGGPGHADQGGKPLYPCSVLLPGYADQDGIIFSHSCRMIYHCSILIPI